MEEKDKPITKTEIETEIEPEPAEVIAALGMVGYRSEQVQQKGAQYRDLLKAKQQLENRVARDAGVLEKAHKELRREMEERQRVEKTLRAREDQLEYQARSMEQVYIALKVLMDGRERDRLQTEKKFFQSLEKLVMPYLEVLETARLGLEHRAKLETIKKNLSDIMSGLADSSIMLRSKLTLSELEVVDEIRKGKSSKEIAENLNVSVPTVSFHRRNIRKKIGIGNKKINLQKYLRKHA